MNVSGRMMKISLTRLLVVTACVCCAAAVYALAWQAKGPSKGEARQLIRRFAGIELPSDAVTVKEISPRGSSAVVTAQIETAFRLQRGDDGKWQVAEVRVGGDRWENVELLTRALNREKTARAEAEIQGLAAALELFRREKGFYVAAKESSVLNDHLHPRYLPRVIRYDPWHRPYEYEGNYASYLLRSNGPDGQPNTADDVKSDK